MVRASGERILELIRQEKEHQAREECTRLVWEHPRVALFRGLLAQCERAYGGTLAAAVHHAYIAVELAPTSEHASLELYFALNRSNEVEAALDEIVRFRSLKESKWYDEMVPLIIRELNRRGDLAEIRAKFLPKFQELGYGNEPGD